MATNLQVEKAVSSTAQPVKDQNGNASSLTLSTNKVGIGTTAPKANLHVAGDIVAGSDVNGQKFIFHTRVNGGGDFLHITGDDANGNWQWAKGLSFVRATGNVGIGTTAPAGNLHIGGSFPDIFLVGDTAAKQDGLRVHYNQPLRVGVLDVKGSSLRIRGESDATGVGATERLFIDLTNGNIGIGTTEPREKLEVNGSIKTNGDILLTNADCAEDFDVCETELIEPGTVMVLGEEGTLEQSQKAYDKRVAGVVSGAGDYKPGIVLDKRESGNTRKPIALLGKAFCKVDAGHGAIEIGDLLTTSPTPGHAMKAVDPLKAFGTVIGKALRPLAEGQGLIPILIALQ